MVAFMLQASGQKAVAVNRYFSSVNQKHRSLDKIRPHDGSIVYKRNS